MMTTARTAKLFGPTTNNWMAAVAAGEKEDEEAEKNSGQECGIIIGKLSPTNRPHGKVNYFWVLKRKTPHD